MGVSSVNQRIEKWPSVFREIFNWYTNWKLRRERDRFPSIDWRVHQNHCVDHVGDLAHANGMALSAPYQLADSELFLLSIVDRQQGSTWPDILSGLQHGWVGNRSKLTRQLATKGLLTIDGTRIRLTEAGIESLRPSRRLFSVYAREQTHIPGCDLEKALNAAAGKNDADMAAWLLDEGANPNGSYPRFRTPLETAAIFGQTDVARLLIARGAEVNLRGGNGWGPLMQAAWYRHTAIIELILSKHPDLTFLEAAAVGDRETVRKFLENGASPNDTSSYTPLDMALQGGHTAVVGLLLDFDATTLAGTPLDVAAESGHAETVAYLLDRFGPSKAEISSALIDAAKEGRLEVVRLLLDRGADPNEQNGSALISAAGIGGLSVTRELLERGAIPTPAVALGVIDCFSHVEEIPGTLELLLDAALAQGLSDGTIDLLRKMIRDR